MKPVLDPEQTDLRAHRYNAQGTASLRQEAKITSTQSQLNTRVSSPVL